MDKELKYFSSMDHWEWSWSGIEWLPLEAHNLCSRTQRAIIRTA